jgi:hypothetical protein
VLEGIYFKDVETINPIKIYFNIFFKFFVILNIIYYIIENNIFLI